MCRNLVIWWSYYELGLRWQVVRCSVLRAGGKALRARSTAPIHVGMLDLQREFEQYCMRCVEWRAGGAVFFRGLDGGASDASVEG
eukprot:9299234-Pyramimonas_sp.AAC.1